MKTKTNEPTLDAPREPITEDSYTSITEDSYTLVEKPLNDHYSVKFKKGKYKGVIVVYGKITIKENHSKGTASLNFKYAIEESANHDSKVLDKSEDFRNHCGDVLAYIIQQALDTGKYRMGAENLSQNKNVNAAPNDSPTETDSR